MGLGVYIEKGRKREIRGKVFREREREIERLWVMVLMKEILGRGVRGLERGGREMDRDIAC